MDSKKFSHIFSSVCCRLSSLGYTKIWVLPRQVILIFKASRRCKPFRLRAPCLRFNPCWLTAHLLLFSVCLLVLTATDLPVDFTSACRRFWHLHHMSIFPLWNGQGSSIYQIISCSQAVQSKPLPSWPLELCKVLIRNCWVHCDWQDSPKASFALSILKPVILWDVFLRM